MAGDIGGGDYEKSLCAQVRRIVSSLSLNAERQLEKKHPARRMMKKVQNKLFVPTMIVSVRILALIIVPVMFGSNL